ncbi:MAG: ABC transporter ATP-binding protein [Acidobacteriota bacterium]|nr:ABC transporter ATP-binding protein [Acidobacteriota bacterium]
MAFTAKPSEGLAPRLEGLLAEGEQIIFCLDSDIGPDGDYGEQSLILTDKRLGVLPPNGEADPRFFDIESVEEAKAEVLVGSGLLTATISGRRVELLQYTNSLVHDFTRAAKAISELVKEKKAVSLDVLNADADEKRCRKCGRVLPGWSDTCIVCVDKSRVLKRIAGYGRPYWPLLGLSLLLSLMATATTLVPPYLSGTLVDDVLTPPSKHPEWLLPVILAMLGARVVAMLIGMGRGWIMVWLAGKVTFDIRSELYQKMQELTLRFFDRKQVGGLISRMTRDTDFLYYFAVDGIMELIVNGLMILGIGAVLFAVQPLLAALVLIPAPAMAFMTHFMFRRIRRVYHRLWHRWSKMSATIGEALSGIRVVKAFAQEPRESGRFVRDAEALFTQGVQAERIWVTFFPILDLATVIGSLLVWFIGGLMVLRSAGPDGTTLGDLVRFQAYIGMFYGPLQSLGRIFSWAQRALTAGERVFEVIDSEPESYDSPDAVPLPDLKGEVEFRKVVFGYKKHLPVLRNVDLHVKPGEMIGLVGHSGAGKSTMINLICRFYDADEGEILIDGMDIRKVKLHDLRHQIGIVPQESFLFSGTIAENIAYAKPDATREDIVRAARAANAHDFIRKRPDGYDSEVGERGSRLSGGEKQRIAIARAILHDPKILILDEATASVDTETEQQIQQAIERLIRSRTTFAIAHRLSTLRNADRLCVIKEGTIAEVGTHDELLAKENGEYAKLVKMQAEISKLKAVDG